MTAIRRPIVNVAPERLRPQPTLNPIPNKKPPRPTLNPMPNRPLIILNPMPPNRSIAFASFLPTSCVMFRDGGTIKLSGLLNKSVSADIRMDGRMSSKEKGKFFVSTSVFMKPNAGVKERAANVDELKELRKAVKKHMREATGKLDPSYDILVTRLNAAIKNNNFTSKIKHPSTVA